eukprot:5004877-Prymnesium_polylepis.1
MEAAMAHHVPAKRLVDVLRAVEPEHALGLAARDDGAVGHATHREAADLVFTAVAHGADLPPWLRDGLLESLSSTAAGS